jgi:DNA replication ATP-dependent helicase Dna2
MPDTIGVSSEELFARIETVLKSGMEKSTPLINKYLHETLVLACNEATRNNNEAYGNVFAQIDFLCRKYNIASPDRFAIQTMRRHTNGIVPIEGKDLGYDLRALAIFVSRIFSVDIPPGVFNLLPHDIQPVDKHILVDMVYIRCIVQSYDDSYIYVAYDGDEVLKVDYINTSAGADLTYIRKLLRKGMQLNLLECHVEKDVVTPRIIVVEPDFLVDISTIAACFRDNGRNPLAYTINRMRDKANSQPILLGNLASSVLDDVINTADFSINRTIRNNFHDKLLEYCSCNAFVSEIFYIDAKLQASNIQQVVASLFDVANPQSYDRSKAMLEPSFICEKLGVQGRVDLMTTDLRLLVEQKSGRNVYIEHNQHNGHGGMQLEDNYVQVLLYYGILRFNFGLSQNKVDIRLLYSKYPPRQGFLVMNYYQNLLREAIKLRNQIVAGEFYFATKGISSYFDHLFISGLSVLEKHYFCRMADFVYREQLLQKVGGVLEQGRCAADLWNMPLPEKIDAGNIYTGLTISRKEQTSDYSGYDLITLDIPEQGEDFLPNFRLGDGVMLYSYLANDEPDVRKNILFKGILTSISSTSLTVCLNDGQQNPGIIDSVSHLFAIEHSVSDFSTSSSLWGLRQFVTSSEHFRNLLLGQVSPARDERKKLSKSYNPTIDDILLKAKQAKDYFLLVGPPGTGKTSMAMRFIVEEELIRKDARILLMSYTNRAVDEICGMLCAAEIPFLRIGSEYSCDERYRRYLIGNRYDETLKLGDIRESIISTRVIVGTTSMLASRSYIFSMLRFTLAVVDEASQILEPDIVGLLGMHSKNGAIDEQCIAKFIMIGDYKQLPAVVQQKSEESAVSDSFLTNIGLTDCRSSLFERLIRWEKHEGRDAFMGILHKQGRMHPDVAEYPDGAFYSSEQLEIVPLRHQQETSLHYRPLINDTLDALLTNHRMIFIPSEYCKSINISDKVNTSEASIVSRILERIYQYYGVAFDADTTVGVIVPYRNQIAMIRKKLEQLRIPQLLHISIDTVERYQGSQRDVIVYSFTVQNNYQLDFLTSNTFVEDGHIIDRKLNVALTRARKQMIMTGNAETLQSNTVFRNLIEYVKSKGGYSTID